jgi:hypothetical protein
VGVVVVVVVVRKECLCGKCGLNVNTDTMQCRTFYKAAETCLIHFSGAKSSSFDYWIYRYDGKSIG